MNDAADIIGIATNYTAAEAAHAITTGRRWWLLAIRRGRTTF